MHISSKKLSGEKNSELLEQLITLVSDLKNERETQLFFGDFLSETEKIVLAKRLAVAVLLSEQKSYQEIVDTLHVSSATISSVAELLTKPGVQLALKKIQEDRWAAQKADQIKKLFPFS